MIRVAQPGFKRVIAMDSLQYGHDNHRMVWGIPFAGMAALSIAFGVFLLNTLPVQPIAFSFLYICAIFVAAVGGRRRWVIVCTAASCAMLALGSFLYAYGPVASLHDVVRLVLDLVVISAVAAYTLKEIALSERLRAQTLLLDQTHDSVTVRDLDGAIRYWNRGASEMYGWALDEARGRIFSRLLKSETAQSLESIKAILCRAGVWEGEILNYSKAGHAIVMNCRWSLLLDERGKPTRVLETVNDVTARKLADQEVRLSEARYRSLFETTGIAIWECDVSQVTHRMEMLRASERRNLRKYVKEHPGFIKELIELTVAKDANGACVSLFGGSSKENLLKCFHKIWLSSGAGMFSRSIVAALEGRTSMEYEASVLNLSGTRLDVLVTIALPSAAAPFTVFISVADITSKTRGREALLEAQNALAHATRVSSLGELAVSIAHEVKQPLTGIVSHGQAGLRWLLREQPDLAAIRNSLEQIVEEGKRATSVIEGVRALARNDPPQLSLVNIHELSRQCIGLLATEIEAANIVLVVPLSDEKGFVLADRTQIQQVIINLLLNAIQALSGLQRRKRVLTVATWISDGAANFLVKDFGPGISPEVRDHLFKAFVTSKSGGMGLGLSVCRSIIDRSGGKIWTEAIGVVGAAFRFRLPLALESENE